MKDINKYFLQKTDGEILSNIISDVIKGSLSGEDLKHVVDELENKGLLNSNVIIDEDDCSKWNETYINNLSFKINLYSREYFVYLEKVAKYINERKVLHEKAVLKFKMIVGGTVAGIAILLLFIIRSCLIYK